MLAQAYDDEGKQLRIFDRHSDLICESNLVYPLDTSADKALKRLRMKRREKWRETDWGYEAKIRFI